MWGPISSTSKTVSCSALLYKGVIYEELRDCASCRCDALPDARGRCRGDGEELIPASTGKVWQAVNTNDLKGQSLQNPEGQKLGTIDNFVLDSKTGQVLYAVVGHGGVLGVGAKYAAVPWQALTYNATKDTLILNMSKDRFESAPTYTKDKQPDFSNMQWQQRTDSHYGVTPMTPVHPSTE